MQQNIKVYNLPDKNSFQTENDNHSQLQHCSLTTLCNVQNKVLHDFT